MKRLIAIGCAALAAATCAFGRDTAIYNGKLTSDLNANGNAVTSLKEPSADSDAATKKYVDAATADAGAVTSVNSQTGAVELAASDVGAVATNDFASATNALAEAIAKAEPGDYAAVSNAAMTALQPAATNGLVTASVTNGLASASALSVHVSDTDNPHKVTAAKLGALTTKEGESGAYTGIYLGTNTVVAFNSLMKYGSAVVEYAYFAEELAFGEFASVAWDDKRETWAFGYKGKDWLWSELKPDNSDVLTKNYADALYLTSGSLEKYATTNDLAAVKASVPVISAADATFSNAVNAAARALVKSKLESLDRAKSSIGETIAALQSIYETETK